MANIYDNYLYLDDLRYVTSLDLPWNKLNNSSILISGATGMLGTFLVDSLMYKNENEGLNCHVLAMGRSKEKAKKRFEKWWTTDLFDFVEHDINKPIETLECVESVDYVLHMASNTHPLAYSTDPIGTITTNLFGLYNMLEFASKHSNKRVAFVSSNEIYGENRGDVEFFDEKYCGYIDCNTMRAGYPESKRCGEALCQAYISQKGMDIVIPRVTRSYGPTLLESDTKALSQFLKKGIAKEDIVLKSAGTQFYSYMYVADSVAGIMTVLLKGESGQAYNISDEKSDIMLKDLAQNIADICGTSVVFEIPDAIEAAGYSTATKARLDNSKILSLGYFAKYDIRSGLEKTLELMK